LSCLHRVLSSSCILGVFIIIGKKIAIPEAVICQEMLLVAQKTTQETDLSQLQAQRLGSPFFALTNSLFSAKTVRGDL
ncbi:unnamed protein product, partial [Bubo scandiacus]